MTVVLRPIVPADIPQITVLNAAAVPAVSPAAEDELGALIKLSHLAIVAVDGSADAPLLGFLICMQPGSAYASENYRYFESRGIDHLYVDRIVVAEDARGLGIGRQLYDSVFELARAEGRREVTCEVNLDPPNPESLAFHARLGFVRVGEQVTKSATVTVALLAAQVS
jgi:predicted GNAT superfamily acetyltransferase